MAKSLVVRPMICDNDRLSMAAFKDAIAFKRQCRAHGKIISHTCGDLFCYDMAHIEAVERAGS
jgi:hypothetical protein